MQFCKLVLHFGIEVSGAYENEDRYLLHFVVAQNGLYMEVCLLKQSKPSVIRSSNRKMTPWQ